MTARRTVVILAAGKGTRMRSPLPKVLHEVGGLSLIGHVVRSCLPLVQGGADLRVVVSAGADGARVAEAARPARAVVQAEQRGTGHAVRLALAGLPTEGTVIVVYGDTPLVPTALLRALAAAVEEGGAEAALASAVVEDASGLGRIVRDAAGDLVRVVEEKDASAAERAIREINAGPCAFRAAPLARVIGLLRSDNAQAEEYLTDAFALLRGAGRRVAVVVAEDPASVGGINTQDELATAAEAYRRLRLRALGRAGVALDGRDVRVDALAEVRAGAHLGAGASVTGRSEVWTGARVGARTEVRDALLREGASILRGTWLGPSEATAQGVASDGAKGWGSER